MLRSRWGHTVGNLCGDRAARPMDEMMFAGWLESQAIDIVKGKLSIYMFAESDFVLEGCTAG